MNLLAVLDQDVEIVIRQEQRSRREAGSPSSRPNCDGREPRGAHGTVHHVAKSSWFHASRFEPAVDYAARMR